MPTLRLTSLDMRHRSRVGAVPPENTPVSLREHGATTLIFFRQDLGS